MINNYKMFCESLSDDKIGKNLWFEYHCLESDKSLDAEIWQHSHQKANVLSISALGGEGTQSDRAADGNPRVYKIQFEDGFICDAFEDELVLSPNDFFRPSPRKVTNESVNLVEEKLRDKLLSIGGDKVKFGLDTIYEQKRMLYDGIVCSLPIKKIDGVSNRCHLNVSDNYIKCKTKKPKIVTGYALHNNVWFQHSWLIKNKMLLETTPIIFEKYYGYVLTPDESSEFCFNNY